MGSQGLTQPLSDARPACLLSDAPAEFEAVFTAHYERVLAILLRLLGERARAEELANEVFWKLYSQPASAQAWNYVGGWLYKTASNLGIDALRSSARRRHYEKAAAQHMHTCAEAAGPLDELLRAENCKRVRAALSGMKRAQAQLLLMRSSGLSYKELAEALDVETGGIGTLLNRAEGEFRKRYLKLAGSKEVL